MIIPRWGLYAMMTGQLLSHLSSHFLIHYHRKIISAETNRIIQRINSETESDRLEDGSLNTSDGSQESRKSASFNNSKQQSALRSCVYKVGKSSKGSKLMIRSWVNILLIFFGLSVIALFIVGCSLPSLQIEYFGLVGIAVELGQAGVNAAKKYSLFQAVSVLIGIARYLGTPEQWVGLISLSLLIIFSTCLVPAVQTAVMLYLWYIPMDSDTSKRKKVVFFIEILQAWQYAEVYLLASLIACWQIGGISNFFFNDLVGEKLDGLLGSIVYYGMMNPEDAQMFHVVASMEFGAYLLFAAAIFLFFMSQFVMRAEMQQTLQLVRELRDNDKIGQKRRAELKDYNIVESNKVLMKKIDPVSAQFTDYFKWLLVPSHHGPIKPAALNGLGPSAVEQRSGSNKKSGDGKYNKLNTCESSDSETI